MVAGRGRVRSKQSRALCIFLLSVSALIFAVKKTVKCETHGRARPLEVLLLMEERSSRAVFVLPDALILPSYCNGMCYRLWRRDFLVEINPLKPSGHYMYRYV